MAIFGNTTVDGVLTVNGSLDINGTQNIDTVVISNLQVTNAMCGIALSSCKLETARTISLTGQVTGSAVFDGTCNIGIVTSLAAMDHTHLSCEISNAVVAATACTILVRDGFGRAKMGAPSAADDIAILQNITSHIGCANSHQVSCIAGLCENQTFTNKTLTLPKLNENVILCSTATQLNNLQCISGYTGICNSNVVFSNSPSLIGTVALPATTSIGSITNLEIGYLSGVTSSIQTQINNKSNTNSPTFTGTPLSTTAALNNCTTQIATTAFVINQINEDVPIDDINTLKDFREWNSARTYSQYDVVIHDGILQVSTQNGNQNRDPTTEADWWAINQVVPASGETFPVGAVYGVFFYRIDLETLFFYNGTFWVEV